LHLNSSNADCFIIAMYPSNLWLSGVSIQPGAFRKR